MNSSKSRPDRPRAIILHGTKGSPDGNWFRWLKEELETRDIPTSVPLLPTPHNQSLENWFNAFDAQIDGFGENSILVGHSAGAIFALRLLERSRKPIGQLVLVAPFVSDIGIAEYDALNKTFTASPVDWGCVKQNAKRIDVYFGDSDPYVPRPLAEEVASSLGVQPHVIIGGGHLNAEAGYLQFPALLAEIEASLLRAS